MTEGGCKSRASPCKHYFSYWSIAKKVFNAYIEKIILQSETFANNVVTHLLIVVQNNIVIRFEHSSGLDALALCILI